MNENSEEPDDIDSAMKDEAEKQQKPRPIHPDGNDDNPDDVQDDSAQDGGQPLAGA